METALVTQPANVELAISPEARIVREALIERGLETPLIQNGLNRDQKYARIRDHFTDTEVLELTVLAGYCVGIGRALQVLDVAVDFDENWTLDPVMVD